MDAIVTKRGGGELKIAEMAAKDLGGHGGDVVEQVNDDCRGCKAEEGFQLYPCGGLEAPEVRKLRVG